LSQSSPPPAPDTGPASRKAPKVPYGHAVGIAAQSIRNRLGRNLITLAGIGLGIAFLMSVFTGNAVRQSADQQRQHDEAVGRVVSRVATVGGRLSDRKITVVGPITSPVVIEGLREVLSRNARIAWHWPGHKPEQERVAQRLTAGLEEAQREHLRPVDRLELALKDSAALVVPARWDEVGLAIGNLGPHVGLMRQPRLVHLADGALADGQGDALREAGLTLFGPAKPDPKLQEQRRRRQAQAAARTVWLVVISILVSFIGIANAMLMSVYERFREIGTMKCLGAANVFVVLVFLLEAAFQGFVGATAGVLVGFLFSALVGLVNHGWSVVVGIGGWDLLGKGALALAFGGVLGVVAAIGPAWRAARMVPADALRTEI